MAEPSSPGESGDEMSDEAVYTNRYRNLKRLKYREKNGLEDDSERIWHIERGKGNGGSQRKAERKGCGRGNGHEVEQGYATPEEVQGIPGQPSKRQKEYRRGKKRRVKKRGGPGQGKKQARGRVNRRHVLNQIRGEPGKGNDGAAGTSMAPRYGPGHGQLSSPGPICRRCGTCAWSLLAWCLSFFIRILLWAKGARKIERDVDRGEHQQNARFFSMGMPFGLRRVLRLLSG